MFILYSWIGLLVFQELHYDILLEHFTAFKMWGLGHLIIWSNLPTQPLYSLYISLLTSSPSFTFRTTCPAIARVSYLYLGNDNSSLKLCNITGWWNLSSLWFALFCFPHIWWTLQHHLILTHRRSRFKFFRYTAHYLSMIPILPILCASVWSIHKDSICFCWIQDTSWLYSSCLF